MMPIQVINVGCTEKAPFQDDLGFLIAGKMPDLEVQNKNVENPRKELEENYYNPKHTGLAKLGLKPHLLTDTVLEEMISVVMEHKTNIKPEQIYRQVKWA